MDLDLSRSIRTQKKKARPRSSHLDLTLGHERTYIGVEKKTPRTRSQVGMYTVRVHGQILTEIQGCCNAPSTDILFCGSVVRSFLMRSMAK